MPFCIPAIDERDYEVFRRIAGAELPSTYDEWFKLQKKKRDNYIMRGHQVAEVAMDPDEFAGYCSAHPHHSYEERLDDLAREKYER